MVDNEVSKAFVETRMGSSPISCTIVKKEKQGIATLEIMCSHTSLSLLKILGGIIMIGIYKITNLINGKVYIG